MTQPKLPWNAEVIMKALPHRPPFLFIDRITEITDKTVIGEKDLKADDPFFREVFKGHFPSRPVMPGVLMLEALAQAGGVLMLTKGENQGKIAYLAAVDGARFRRPVLPGETLRLEIELLKLKSRIGLVHGVAKVGTETACEADLMFSLAE